MDLHICYENHKTDMMLHLVVAHRMGPNTLGSADSAWLGETVPADDGGAQSTVWVCPSGGEEGFYVRAHPALGRSLPPWVDGTYVTAMGVCMANGLLPSTLARP